MRYIFDGDDKIKGEVSVTRDGWVLETARMLYGEYLRSGSDYLRVSAPGEFFINEAGKMWDALDKKQEEKG